MPTSPTPAPPPSVRRPPVYLNLFAIRQPVPAIVSILHRASGALLFLAGIPLALWGLQASLGSPEAYASFVGTISPPLAKLVLLVLLWSYLHHLFAGVRHLLLDVHVGTDLAPARRSSAVVLVLALLVTLAIAVRLW
jgi:succinate dehydrogenase / fumarate reductase, cytochrome b subunit